jgi:exopolysaccharide biosynthesis polyprenyl glycosylphosphotransferase
VVIGFVDDHPLPLDPSLRDIPVFDGLRPLSDTIELTGATRLLIAFSGVPADDVLDTLRGSRVGWIPVGIVPRYFELIPNHAKMLDIDGIPVMDLHGANLSSAAQAMKRALDVVLGGLGLLVLSPVMAVIAVAIKLDSEGPVLFAQRRTGRAGESFRMWKFRTMVRDAELIRPQLDHRNDMKNPGPLFKMRDDPRVTRVGRVLRRYSLDELPQLFNVLGGTMSLVGPRPFIVREAEQMEGWSRRRLDIRPGITGLWQVRGRNDVPFDEMIRLDYLYVTTWSVWWDLRIMLQTVPLVLGGRGAS